MGALVTIESHCDILDKECDSNIKRRERIYNTNTKTISRLSDAVSGSQLEQSLKIDRIRMLDRANAQILREIYSLTVRKLDLARIRMSQTDGAMVADVIKLAREVCTPEYPHAKYELDSLMEMMDDGADGMEMDRIQDNIDWFARKKVDELADAPTHVIGEREREKEMYQN